MQHLCFITACGTLFPAHNMSQMSSVHAGMEMGGRGERQTTPVLEERCRLLACSLSPSLACPSILLLLLLLTTICSLFSSTGFFSSVSFLSLSPIKLVVVCVSKIKLMFGYHGTFSFLSTRNTRVRTTNTCITTTREGKKRF